MKKYLLIIFILTSTNSVFSQEKTKFEKYDELVWCAMIQYKNQNYKLALENFEKAFVIIPNEDVSDYFYAAASALHLEKNEKAKELIIQSIINTDSSIDYFLNFEEFNPFRSLKLFEEISKGYSTYRLAFYENLEFPEIYKEIRLMIDKDQDVRINGGDMNGVDTPNIIRLIEITKNYGWQNRSWLILWHQRLSYGSNDYVWSFFKPYIDEQILLGKMRKDFWARFEEFRSFETTGKQIYGFWWSQFDEIPVADIENLDKRRKEMGIPPMWYLEKIYGITPPKEYKITQESSAYIQCD